MIRRRQLAFVALALAAGLAACKPKAGEPSDDAASASDSAAMRTATDSTMMAQPPAALIDSATKAKAGAGATTMKGTTSAKTPEKMGHDSAFGPSFIVDSTGKLIPIPAKKP